MKITLISPYPDIQAFGIRTLSACLKREGHDVQLIFLPRRFTHSYEEKPLDEVAHMCRGADLIGISLMTNFFDNVVQITQRLKKGLSIPILWGGIHPTIRPEECLNYADIVCIGEAEYTLIELVSRIEGGQDYRGVQGIWLKDKGNIIRNEIPSLIQDLDSIPFPDYDYETHYILDGKGVQKMSKGSLQKYTAGTYMTMPTRGCPYACSYCCNNTLNKMYPHQKVVRQRSVNNIIKELSQVKLRLPVMEQIKFDDDAFFLYTLEEIREFSERYKENIRLPLMITGATPLSLTREKLSLLVNAGLVALRMGIETGSEHTRRNYKRTHSNQQVEKAVNIINEFKDKIKRPLYDIILDNPWEREEDLIETLMFLAKLPPPYALALYSLTLYPETELYEKAKRDGMITDDLKDVYRKYYLGCKRTYLNGLFFLLNEYTRVGTRLSPKTVSLLTNRKLRRLKLNWLLYILLKTRAIPLRFQWLLYLLREGLKDVRKGNWSRITMYIKKL